MATECDRMGKVIVEVAGVSNILNKVDYLLSHSFSL